MKNNYLCYAVVNLLFPSTTVEVVGSSLEPFFYLVTEIWWAQMEFFKTIWLLCNQSPPHFSPLSRSRDLVGSNGLGPSTSRLSGVCSNQLSYEPIMVEVIGFEPMTPCLQGRCSTSWAIPPFLAKAYLCKINASPSKEACELLKTNKKETICLFRSTRNG